MTTRKLGVASVSFLATLLLTFLMTVAPALAADGTDNAWRVTGPTGGDVRDLVVDPANPDRFYFGTLDGQLYTSADAGRNWSLLYNFQRPKMFVDCILVDSRDNRTLYVGTHRHQEPGGFYKSVDGGRTWRESAALRNEAIYSMVQSFQDPNLFLVGTNHGIFRSDNSGETWRMLPTQDVPGPTGLPGGLKNVESLAINPTNKDIIYAGTWFLPYRSTDGGQTWRVIKTGFIEDSDVFAIDIDQTNPRHIIASACSGIYETFDGGDNWKKIQGIPSSSRRTRAILQHPTIKGLYFAGTTEGFWRSEDGGVSWQLVTSKTLEINAIVVHPSRPNDVYISTNNYGVMLARDAGRNFAPTNNGYSSRFANAIVPDSERPNRFYATTINTATGGGFFFISDDGGLTWQASVRNMSSRVTTYAILQDAVDANIIYLGTNYGLYRSADRGASWSYVSAPKAAVKGKAAVAAASPEVPNSESAQATTRATPSSANLGARQRTTTARRAKPAPQKTASKAKKAPAKPAVPKPLFVTDPVVALAQFQDATGKRGLLAATNSGLYRTFDANKGGELITYGANLDSRTTFVTLAPNDMQTIWVGTVSSGVLVSRDGGATWQRMAGVPSEVPITFIKLDERQPERVYVGNKQTLYLTQDGGQTWRRRGGGLPFGEYYALTINPNNSDDIVTGNAYQNEAGGPSTFNSGGIYRSFDGGQTWARVDATKQSLPSHRIWALLFDPRTPGRLLVGSHSSGIYVFDDTAAARNRAAGGRDGQ